MKKKPIILGIETSCDETAASIIQENKEYVNKARSSWTNQFWQDIREMGGTVSGLEGECEVEYSPKLDLNDFNKVE